MFEEFFSFFTNKKPDAIERLRSAFGIPITKPVDVEEFDEDKVRDALVKSLSKEEVSELLEKGSPELLNYLADSLLKFKKQFLPPARFFFDKPELSKFALKQSWTIEDLLAVPAEEKYERKIVETINALPLDQLHREDVAEKLISLKMVPPSYFQDENLISKLHSQFSEFLKANPKYTTAEGEEITVKELLLDQIEQNPYIFEMWSKYKILPENLQRALRLSFLNPERIFIWLASPDFSFDQLIDGLVFLTLVDRSYISRFLTSLLTLANKPIPEELKKLVQELSSVLENLPKVYRSPVSVSFEKHGEEELQFLKKLRDDLENAIKNYKQAFGTREGVV